MAGSEKVSFASKYKLFTIMTKDIKAVMYKAKGKINKQRIAMNL